MRAFLFVLAFILMWLFWSAVKTAPASAHPGRLNAEGCHNNRKTGDYHCHRGKSRIGGAGSSRGLGLSGGKGGLSFRNCSSARAAGAAPVRAGDPGYGRHLDRDGDGVGCE
jgi:hypothetical protein